MNGTEFISRLDFLFRPIITSFSPKFAIKFYSTAKRFFLTKYVNQTVDESILKEIKEILQTNQLSNNNNGNNQSLKSTILWGISFNLPVFNSAGMFKYGYGYEQVAKQGAGAFLLGTSTSKQRLGNIKNNVKHPFLSYPKSKLASNWMGLPNNGHKDLKLKIDKIKKIDGCPIGVSLSADPEDTLSEKLNGLLEGLLLFENSQVDFLEINESCPNVIGHSSNDNPLDDELLERLHFISDKFLKKRKRNLPVILKFSNDTNPELVPELIKLLIDLEFDGINIGNTSTNYKLYQDYVRMEELNSYKYFTQTYGGGLSGTCLKDTSMKLSKIAVKTLEEINKINGINNINQNENPKKNKEFHIIRTGGIEGFNDIKQSLDSGISLVQWYTGYFSMYGIWGNKIYLKILKDKIG